MLPSRGCVWIRRWSTRDLVFAGIASFETLVQIALLHCMTAALPGGCVRVRVRPWSDNLGAERKPTFYTRRYSSMSLPSAHVSHILGEFYDDANFLCRWTGDNSLLPGRFPLSRRVPLRCGSGAAPCQLARQMPGFHGNRQSTFFSCSCSFGQATM